MQLPIDAIALSAAARAEATAPGAHSTPPLAARSALRSLLGLLGLDLREALAEESTPDGVSIEALAEQLQRHGLPLRVVHLEPGELDELRLPTLVMLRSGAAVVLVSIGSRSVTFLAETGQPERMARAAFAARFAGAALDGSSPLGSDGSLLQRLLHWLDAEKGRLWAPLSSAAVVFALGLLAPLLTRNVLDRALPWGDRSLLEIVVLATLLVALQSAWLSILRERALLAVDALLSSTLSHTLYTQFVRLPFLAAQRTSVGTFSEAIASAGSISRALSAVLLSALLDGVAALAYLALLFAASAPAARVALACGLVLLLWATGFAARLSSIQQRLIGATGDQLSGLHDLISGAGALRSCGGTRAAVARWLPRLITARALAVQQGRVSQWLDLGGESSRRLVGLFAFAAGAQAVLAKQLSVGEFVASVMYADGYAASLCRLAASIRPLFTTQGKLRSLDALGSGSRELATALPRSSSEPASALASSAAPAIVLDDVWFRYTPDGPWILRGHQLRIERGEQRVLRGASGMGKTTILRLIAGLLQPERGDVLVFGQRPMAASGVVTYLPQDTTLFAGSILSNLRLLSGATHPEVLAAAERTGLSALAAQWPMGLDTFLPSGGGNLSGGQRQLVLLTAAVASQRPVALLDESLANVDRARQHELRRSGLFAGRTLLEVTHEEAVH